MEQNRARVQTTQVEILVKTQTTFREFLLTQRTKKSSTRKRVKATNPLETQRSLTNKTQIKRNQPLSTNLTRISQAF